MKKFGRKLLGLCLAASLAVTAVPPTQGMAAQGGENTYAAEAEQPDAGASELEEPGAGDTQKPDDEPEAGDTVKPDDGPGAGDVQKPDAEPGTEAAQPTEAPGEETEPENTQNSGDADSAGKEPGTGEIQPIGSTQEPGEETESGNEQRPGGKQEEGNLGDVLTGTETPEDDAAEETEATMPTEDTQAIGEFEGEENVRGREAEADDIMLLAETFDVNQPVIESFEFVENGQALTADDTLHFNISAYDADSGIKSVEVSVYSNQTGTFYISCTKTGNGNLYAGTRACSQITGTSFYVSRVRVIDNAGNYVDFGDVKDEKGLYRYKFTADCSSTSQPAETNIWVSNIQKQEKDVDGNGVLNAGDAVTYTADVTCKNGEEVSSVYMYMYVSHLGYYESPSTKMTYDAETQKLTGTFAITDQTYPHTWSLYYLRVQTKAGKSYTFYSSAVWPGADVKFTVVNDGFDVDRPVIESITIDKNGQIVRAGDIVTITVKVSEEHPSQTARAQFSTMISNVLVSRPYIYLKLNTETMEYTGTIEITDDTYPCEWDLTDLWVYDEVGHDTYLYNFQSDISSTYPWYYRVMAGDTYAEDVKDVPVKIYGRAQQEDGTIVPDSLLFDGVVKNVGRRASIEELGVLQKPLEGNAPSGWKYDGKVADADTRFLFLNSAARTFTACYDKGCANVALTYMTLSGETKTVNVPVFVDREASFRDVLDALKLPEDARTGDFDGFELLGADEDAKVGDVANLSVSTNYAGTQVACTLHYFDRYGSPVSRQDSRTYPAGTRISDVLAGLETPEDVSGAAFEKWILPDYEGDADDVPGSSLRLDVTAVYRGKTTVDTLLAYRGTDGKMAEVKKMVLADGEDPSDADLEGQATDAFKDAEHYKGLRLSEWKGNTTKKLEQYREIDFTAVYYNCFITMRYPDGSREYAVADKGASFTLPSENETYRNIVWEGYGAGAAVKVTGDMEFTVADAEQKGEETPPETTGGVRLTEEEIEEIVKKAREASDGETVRVDMRKATVIPKEVLEAIRDRSVAVVLDMGTYSWTVNGLDVLATEQRDIDLEVKVDTDAVPSGLVRELAGDSPTTQLSLTHDGDFGFRADLTLNLGSGHAGGTGNLYYYDSTGKLVFISSGGIAEDGTTSLSFSHASDYVIVIGPGKTSAEPEETPSGPEMPSGGKEDGGSDVREPSARVRDDASEAEVPGGTDEGSDDDASGGAPSAGTAGNGSAERRPGSGRMRSPRTGE